MTKYFGENLIAKIKEWAAKTFAAKGDVPPYIYVDDMGESTITVDGVKFRDRISDVARKYFNVRSFEYDGDGTPCEEIGIVRNGHPMPLKLFKLRNVSIRKQLDLDQIDTYGVTDMSYMFQNATAYTIKGLENLNTDNVTTMEGMFSGFTTYVFNDTGNTIVRWWNMANVVSVKGMFAGIRAGGNINVRFPNMPKLKDASNLFNGNTKAVNVSLSGASITDLSYAFNGCTNLTTLYLGIQGYSINDMGSAFSGCTGLQSLEFAPDFFAVKDSVGTVDLSACGKLDDDTVALLKTGLYDRKAMKLGVLTA